MQAEHGENFTLVLCPLDSSNYLVLWSGCAPNLQLWLHRCTRLKALSCDRCGYKQGGRTVCYSQNRTTLDPKLCLHLKL